MITRQELKDLAAFAPSDSHFVSLYLNVDPRDNPKSDFLLHYKALAKKTLSSLDAKLRNQVKEDAAAIEKFLADRPKGMKRGLAVISSHAQGFWQPYHIAFPFINQLVVERKPFVKPLMTMLDLHQRYLIVAVAGTGARVFIYGMGELREVTNLSRPPAPTDPTRDGRSGDMGKVRAEHHKEQAQRLLFKDLALLLERKARDEDISRVLIGGNENTRGRFRDSLGAPFSSKVVGEFAIDQNAGAADIIKRALPIMKDVEYGFERKALAELFGKHEARGNSVLGLSDVLTGIQQGNIRKLYVMSNMATPGMMCDKCGALTPVVERNCPYCGGHLSPINYMHDIVILKAVEQGARIDTIDESPDLAKAGGIGALLRY